MTTEADTEASSEEMHLLLSELEQTERMLSLDNDETPVKQNIQPIDDIPRALYRLKIESPDGKGFLDQKWDGENIPEILFEDSKLPNITIQNHFIKQIPDSIQNIADFLTHVDLCGNNISELPDTFFSLKRLQCLNINYNSLSEAPENIVELSALDSLHMKGNRIEMIRFENHPTLSFLDLTDNILKGEDIPNIATNTNLRKLLVGSNRISSWPESLECLSELKNLEELDLSNNQIKQVPLQLYSLQRLRKLRLDHNLIKLARTSQNHFLQELNLANNYIESLPDFACLTGLTELSVENNYLLEIRKEFFGESVLSMNLSGNALSKLKIQPATQRLQLEKLLIDRNNFTSIPKSLSNLPKLRYLSMTSNFVQEVAFPSPMKSLRLLNLANNKIRKVNENTTTALVLVEDLNLSYNDLMELPDFSKLTFLSRLDISGNKFTTYPRSIVQLEKLEELTFTGDNDKIRQEASRIKDLKCKRSLTSLNLARQDISTLADELKEFTNISILNLSENKLQTLPNSINKLTNLKILNIEKNNLKTGIPKSLKVKSLQISQLYMSGSKLDNLRGIQYLKSLQKLDVSNNNLSTVDEGIKELTNLVDLQLNNNQLIDTIPKGVKHLKKLQILNISKLRKNKNRHLNIDEVTSKAWSLTLKELKSSGNMLETLPNELFDLKSLTHLDLSNNSINHAECERFSRLSGLQTLNLSNNEIEQFPEETIQCTSMLQLNLGHNAISEIEEGTLTSKNKIEQLDLSYNKLKVIPKSLVSFQRLFHLNIAGNLVETFPDEMDMYGPKLKHIELNRNKIEELPVILGDSARKFESVNVSHNQIRDISGIFCGIEILEASSNKLKEFDSTILEKVKTLDIGFNGVEEFSFLDGDLDSVCERIIASNNHNMLINPGISLVRYLKCLYLAEIGLTELPQGVNDLRFLTELNLCSNKLTRIPKRLSSLQYLVTLDLSCNAIKEHTEEDRTFMKLPYLKEVDLSKNDLDAIPMDDNQSITKYNVSFNQIKTIDETIRGMRSLKVFKIAENSLEIVPAVLFENQTLETVDLRSNKIRRVEIPTPDKLKSCCLKDFNISDNDLKELDAGFALLGKLECLDLSGNKISFQGLPPGLFALLQNVSVLLHDNPVSQNFSSLDELEAFLKSGNLNPIQLVHLQALLHGESKAALRNLELFISSDDTAVDKGRTFTLKMNHKIIKCFLCNPLIPQLLEATSSKGTIHLICVDLDQCTTKLDESNFDKVIGRYIMEICSCNIFPIIRIVGCTQVSALDKKVDEMIKQYIESKVLKCKEATKIWLSKNHTGLSVDPKSGLSYAEPTQSLFQDFQRKNFWNFPSNITLLTQSDTTMFENEIAEICQHKEYLPQQPNDYLSSPWRLFCNGVVELVHKTQLHYLKKENCVEIARDVEIPDVVMTKQLDTIICNMHLIGDVLSVNECDEMNKFLFKSPSVFMEMLEHIFEHANQSNGKFKLQDIGKILWDSNEYSTEAKEFLCLLASRKFQWIHINETEDVFMPYSMKEVDAPKYIGKWEELKDTPPNFEGISTTVSLLSPIPKYVFSRYVVQLIKKFSQPPLVNKNAISGESMGCNLTIVIQGKDMCPTMYDEKTVILVRIRGEVKMEAYGKGILTLNEYKGIPDKRQKINASDGFSEAYTLHTSILKTLEQVLDIYPSVQYVPGNSTYKLGKSDHEIDFDEWVLLTLEKKVTGNLLSTLAKSLSPSKNMKSPSLKDIMTNWIEVSGDKATCLNLCKKLQEFPALKGIADDIKQLCKEHRKLTNWKLTMPSK